METKDIKIDIETYNVLRQAADAECRSIPMQIRWLVKNSNSGSVPRVVQTQIPTMRVSKTKPKRVKTAQANAQVTNPDTNLNKVLWVFDSGLTLCSKDFRHVVHAWGEVDASRELNALERRGDVVKIGNTKPYHYCLSPLGRERINIIKRSKL
tara:strand:+ start:238 stop:696 length:459 start_codon:yes stop_codon:yes gene_type:complete